MLRRALLAAMLLLLSAVAEADSVRIEEVGIQGFYEQSEATRVRVAVVVDAARPQPLQLRFSVRSLDPKNTRVDTFTRTLGVDQRAVLDVPVFLLVNNQPVLEVELRDASGQVLARDTRQIPPHLGSQRLLAVHCADETVCREVEGQIALSARRESDEEDDNYWTLRAVRLTEPVREWWIQGTAHVIVAAPQASWPAEQRQALEDYVRLGGTLIVVEDLAGPGELLRPYFTLPAQGVSQPVGLGTLVRLPNLKDEALTRLLRSKQFRSLYSGRYYGRFRWDRNWLQTRLATAFDFPSFRSVTVWLVSYIVFVGAVNFGLLRRAKRLELGWITVPVVALLFAAGMYISSAARRPDNHSLDQIAVYWMDQHSSRAAMTTTVRVASPDRRTLMLSVPRSQLLHSSHGMPYGMDYDGLDLLDTSSVPRALHLRLGEDSQIEVPVLQWSFRDLSFRAPQTLPGTVTRTAAGGLRNETGRAFEQALYADASGVYALGSLAAGAEVNLKSAKRESLPDSRRREGIDFRHGSGDDDLPPGPFELSEFIWKASEVDLDPRERPVFLGLSREPDFGGRLLGLSPQRKNYAITVVFLDIALDAKP